MYSGWLSWNFRLKLITLVTLTVSIALAVVFLLIVSMVREQAVNRRFVELENGVKRISADWAPPESLAEASEDFPGLSFAAFGKDGAPFLGSAKRLTSVPAGRSRRGDEIRLGVQVGPIYFVGKGSLLETEAGIAQLALVLAGLWLPLTVLTAAVSWYGGGLVLRPVRELVASAEKLSGTTDGQELTTTDRADFASLAQSLNQMISRVRHAAELQEQFASDAAHELRTPLALIRTRVEANLKRPRTPEEHVASQTALLRQIERLSAIVGTLLVSARRLGPATEVIAFHEAVQRAAGEWAELRDWPSERLRLELQPCSARIGKEEVTIIVRNLLDNAATFSPPSAPIIVTTKESEGGVTLLVRDFGQGLTSEEMCKAFGRFYRSDEARSRLNGGAGIGLAVVRRIVEASGGTIEFLPADSGALISMTLSPPIL